MTLSRRQFIATAAAVVVVGCTGDDDAGPSPSPSPTGASTTTTAGPAVTAPEPPPVDLAGEPFTLGIASGDPAETAVVVWTRLLPAGGGPSGDVPLVWEVATDDSFADLAAAGLTVAAAADAHSVHVDVTGLTPATAYWYRFRAGTYVSPTGRTRTAPERGTTPERLRFALASCQDWEDGYYTAHPHLAAEEVDMVVFVGDYIYEASSGAVRSHGAPEAVDLDGYRARYALYRSDPGLQAAHAAVPWVVTWDDHEVRGDYADGDIGADRRAAAYRAWWEHQPVRVPAPDGEALPIHRTVEWGTLARFLVLDTRQYRSDQACGGGVAERCPEIDADARTLLGAGQEQWLTEQLATGGDPTRWVVVAQQVVMTDLAIAGRLNTDQWDGYAPARARLLAELAASVAESPIVLSGDVHAAVVSDLAVAGGDVVATELVSPSLSSRFPDDLVSGFGFLPAVRPAIQYADATGHGYVVCDVTPDRWQADYRIVSTVTEPSATIATAASFEIRPDAPGARRL